MALPDRGTIPRHLNRIGSHVVDAALDVHRELGPGLFESTYQSCLQAELIERGLDTRREVVLPLRYKGRMIDQGYRIDLLVEDEVIVETKAVASLVRAHESQLLTYLKLSGLRLGYLINFNEALLKDGIKRRAL